MSGMDKSEAFDVLVSAFRNLTPPEKANLAWHARNWPEGKIACGGRASTYFDNGFA